jgi:hypothetical protein
MSCLPDIIRVAILKALTNNEKPFTAAMRAIKDIESEGATCLSELRYKSTTAIGTLFEKYCAYYLVKVWGFVEVYRISEAPQHYLDYFNLKRQDKGIDLIGLRYSNNGNQWIPNWFAIQCKYRGKGQKVTWTDLSTFYNLASRSGNPGYGWAGHVTMCNSYSLPDVPSLHSKDVFIIRKDFENIPDWYQFIDYYGNKLTCENEIPTTIEELRNARLKKLDK